MQTWDIVCTCGKVLGHVTRRTKPLPGEYALCKRCAVEARKMMLVAQEIKR